MFSVFIAVVGCKVYTDHLRRVMDANATVTVPSSSLAKDGDDEGGVAGLEIGELIRCSCHALEKGQGGFGTVRHYQTAP